MQGPHRAGKRGGGASALPQIAGFGRWAKAEPTASGCQGMDAQNAVSGVHARPGRLLTPRARGGAFGSPLNRRLRSIRSRCRGLKCSAKMGVLTVLLASTGGTHAGMPTGEVARTFLAARAAGAKHPTFSILSPDRCLSRYLCPGRRMVPPACSRSRAECERV
jgi:hypothetical protein